MGEWIRCDKGRRCPICSKAKYCALHVDGYAKCMQRGAGDAPDTPGWRHVKSFPPTKGGAISDGGDRWDPPGGVAERSAGAAAAKSAKLVDEDRRRKQREGRARKWWGEAGSANLDGGADHPRIRAYIRARGVDPDLFPGGVVPKVQRLHPECPDTFNPDGKRWLTFPAIVSKVIGGDGTFGGIHRLFLHDDEPAKRPAELGECKKKYGSCKGGVIPLSDNTASGVLVLTTGVETGWALLAAVRGEAAVWCAGDDVALKQAVINKRLALPGSSQALHTVVLAGDLDDDTTRPPHSGQEAIEAKAAELRKLYPWLSVYCRLPHSGIVPDLVTSDGTRDVPRAGKSVDWLDVYGAIGRDRTGRALFAEVDFAKNRARQLEWKPGGIDESELPAGVKVVDESNLRRARQYLVEREAPAAGKRAGSTFLLRRWKDDWFEYDDTEHRWCKLPAEVLHARVWDWLDGFHYATKRGEVHPVDPTGRTVDDVVRAMIGDVAVLGDQVPVWLPPSFDDRGEAMFGEVPQRKGRRPEPQVDAGYLVPYANGILDTRPLIEKGKVRRLEHDPRFFSLACLPHDLDFDALEASLVSDQAAERVFAAKCPTWMRFLSTAWDDLFSPRLLQEFMGLSLIPYTRLERLLMIQGGPGSGKGTIYEIWREALGKHNVAGTSFNRLTERFHLSTLVGKLLAAMSDASVTRFTDTGLALEILKQISAGDPLPVESKYVRDVPTINVTARVVIFVNDVPDVLDPSGAFADRLVLLPMEKSFRKSGDPTMKDRLLLEVPGVTIWMLHGLIRLLRAVELRAEACRTGDAAAARLDVFTAVPDVEEEIEEMRRANSPIYAFKTDCLVTEPYDDGAPREVDAAEVYSAWVDWCEEHTRKPGSIESMGRKIKSVVPARKVKQNGSGQRGRRYVGIGLSDEGERRVDSPGAWKSEQQDMFADGSPRQSRSDARSGDAGWAERADGIPD